MRSAAVIAVLLLAACPPARQVDVDAGPADAGSADAGPGGVDPTSYCEDIADFFCDFYVRCGRMAVPDAAACKPVFLEACNARFEPTYVSLANAGLLTLSQDGIDQCKQHLDTVACDQQVQDLDGPCANMWVGTQPAGASCGFDIETFTCAPGTTCALDITLCGTCQPTVDDGQSCAPQGVSCKATSECNSTTLLCEPRAKPGESCGGDTHCVLGAVCDGSTCKAPSYAGVGDACDFSNRCPYGSTCVADGNGNASCTATVELGQPCGPDAPCDSGFCDPSSSTCVALRGQREACSEGAQCQTGACDNGACRVVPSACFNPP